MFVTVVYFGSGHGDCSQITHLSNGTIRAVESVNSSITCYKQLNKFRTIDHGVALFEYSPNILMCGSDWWDKANICFLRYNPLNGTFVYEQPGSAHSNTKLKLHFDFANQLLIGDNHHEFI